MVWEQHLYLILLNLKKTDEMFILLRKCGKWPIYVKSEKHEELLINFLSKYLYGVFFFFKFIKTGGKLVLLTYSSMFLFQNF